MGNLVAIPGEYDVRTRGSFLAAFGELQMAVDNLGPGAGQNPIAPVQVRRDGVHPSPGLGQVHLHELVAVGEAVTFDHALVDHGAAQAWLAPQSLVDEICVVRDHLLRVRSDRTPRRACWCPRVQKSSHGAPVAPDLADYLGPAHARRPQAPETSHIQPSLL